MAKFLCRYRVVQCIFPPTPYQFRVTRNIALPPNIPLSMPDEKSDCDVLHPYRRDELQNGPCASGPGCVLAGDPYSSSILPKEIREEVLRKWNQGPKPDLHKEWVKYAIYY